MLFSLFKTYLKNKFLFIFSPKTFEKSSIMSLIGLQILFKRELN
jgi:hypothetical protein